MAGTVVLLNVAMVGILYVLFGRVLDPLTVLAGGLSDLEAAKLRCANAQTAGA